MRTGTKEHRKKFFAFAFVALPLLLLILFIFSGPSEPVYQGRTLSSWLKRAGSHGDIWSNEDVANFREEQTAIRNTGTNAIPLLLQMLRTRDWPLEERWNGWVVTHNLYKLHVREAWEERRWAISGFSILGSQAAPAIPGLIKLLNDNDAGVRLGAASSLSALADTGKDVMSNAIPALVQHLNDPDQAVRDEVAWALSRMKCEPQNVVPALVAELQSSNLRLSIFISIIQALGEYGTNAMPAIEVLQKCSTYANANVRKEAQKALQKITNSPQNRIDSNHPPTYQLSP